MASAAQLAAPDAPRPPQGWTPLHWAAYGGHVEVVKALVGLGAAVDVRNVSEGKYQGSLLKGGCCVGVGGGCGAAAFVEGLSGLRRRKYDGTRRLVRVR